MRGIIALAVLFAAQWANAQNATGYNLETAKDRCSSTYENSQKLYSGDLQWNIPLADLEQKFQEVYESGKRLSYHSTYEPHTDSFFLHFKGLNKMTPVKISPLFIKSVTLQIEQALKAGYAEYILFSDMGHSHLYFDQQHWDETYKSMDLTDTGRPAFYEKAFADPLMKVLYHTAEQIKMTDNDELIDDEHIQFRYWNRNVVGLNNESLDLEILKDPSAKGNTVSSIDGHQGYGAGFQISASEKGCFPFKTPQGETLYFDIGLEDLESNPNSDPILF